MTRFPPFVPKNNASSSTSLSGSKSKGLSVSSSNVSRQESGSSFGSRTGIRRFEAIFGAVKKNRRIARSNSNSNANDRSSSNTGNIVTTQKKEEDAVDGGKENEVPPEQFLLNKRKDPNEPSSVESSFIASIPPQRQGAFSSSESAASSLKQTVPLLNYITGPRGSSKAFNSEDIYHKGVPHPNDRVQTVFKVKRTQPQVAEVDEEEDDSLDSPDSEMMDLKKPFQAPPNPPPPVPNHKRHLNGGETSPTASDHVNGGYKASASVTLKKPTAVVNGIPPNASVNGTPNGPITKFSNGAHVVTSERNVPQLNISPSVGLESIPYQLVHKCQKDGFQFNLMCVGETGMGKTTLIESLFNMKLEFEPCNNELKTVELRTKTCDVKEGAVHVKMRIVETAGFGDQLDKDKSFSAKVIVDYINQQFESYLKEELRICRQLARYDDTRIHACLYFISPTGHGLKALDVVTMRELSKRVNVIPVIAKSDTTCKDELARFKQKILSELKSQNIEIYQFPTDDETVRKENLILNSLMPFAVVGSTDFVAKEDGRQVRARRYPWGIVEVENEEHCDFVKLREALLRINVDNLRMRTHEMLYESYRRDRLREMKIKDGDCGPKFTEAYEAKEREFREEMKQKEEEFQRQFIERVNAKEAEIQKREEQLIMDDKKVRETFEADMRQLDSQINTLIEEKARLEGRLTSHGKKKQKV